MSDDPITPIPAEPFSNAPAVTIDGAYGTPPIRNVGRPVGPMIDNVQRAARLLVEARDRSEAIAAEGRRAMRAAGHSIDTRVSYAEGSHAAYAVACSILAGAMGVPSIDVLTGETWEREDRSDKVMERPVLPGELTDPIDG